MLNFGFEVWDWAYLAFALLAMLTFWALATRVFEGDSVDYQNHKGGSDEKIENEYE